MLANVQTLAMFAQNLSNQLRSPVLDKTGLAGTYDFVLDFTLDRFQGFDGLGGVPPPPPPPAGATGAPGAPLAAPPQDEAPSIFVALQEQLGLRLEKRKGPVDVLVIDHADKMPTEN
jgi:uncharacterized protein (TIGR03435 family)